MSGVWIGIGIAATGLATSVYGQQQGKKAGQADAAFLAAQQADAAMKSRAIGQRQAIQERKQAKLVSSALQARAMGGGLDPGVVELEKEIAGEGEYRALAALYEGNEGALGLENQANAGLRSASARGRAYDIQTAGTILEGASKMYGRYSSSPAPSSVDYIGTGSTPAPVDY